MEMSTKPKSVGMLIVLMVVVALVVAFLVHGIQYLLVGKTNVAITAPIVTVTILLLAQSWWRKK